MMNNEKVLEKHIVGENGISYTLGEDGLYYPDFKLPEGTYYEIGKYGRLRWEYLKNHRRGEYNKLLMEVRSVMLHILKIQMQNNFCYDIISFEKILFYGGVENEKSNSQ